MRRPLLTLLSLFVLAGCGGSGVGFEVGDGEKDRAKDPEKDIELPPRPLIVRGPEAGPEINHVLLENAASLTAFFDYTAPADERLTVYVVRTHGKRCGDMNEPVPEFTWVKLPPAGDATTAPEETKLVPTEPFVAAKGRAYQLRVEMGTSWGECDMLGVSFDVRLLPANG